MRGRFLSKPVLFPACRVLFVGYIDANAVQAGLAPGPWAYPWGSAPTSAQRAGPPLLTREWVESAACDRLRAARDEQPDRSIRIERRARSGWRILEVGLLHNLTANTLPQIAAGTSRNAVGATRLYREHSSLLKADECYPTRAVECATASFAELRTHLRLAGGAGR